MYAGGNDSREHTPGTFAINLAISQQSVLWYYKHKHKYWFQSGVQRAAPGPLTPWCVEQRTLTTLKVTHLSPGVLALTFVPLNRSTEGVLLSSLLAAYFNNHNVISAYEDVTTVLEDLSKVTTDTKTTVILQPFVLWWCIILHRAKGNKRHLTGRVRKSFRVLPSARYTTWKS